MGFISKTLKAMQQKDRQAAPLTAGCMSNIQMWNVPPTQRVDLIVGDKIAKVYIYDAGPLYNIDPEGFRLTVAYCDGILTSQYTGTVSDTARNGFVVVMYNQLPVGTVAINRELVMQAARQGIALDVFAYADGWINYGSQQIRDIKAKVPREWKCV